MEIKYLGNYGVTLKGKKESIVVDGVKNDEIKKFPGRLVVFSQDPEMRLEGRDDQIVVTGPGEYEVAGVEMTGINSGSQSTIFTMVMDGVSVCLLGKLSEALSDKKIDKLTNIDVLVIPLDGPMGDAKIALDLAKKSGANYVVPIAYNESSLKLFLDGVDREDLTAVDSLKVNRDELPEGLEIVVLKDANEK